MRLLPPGGQLNAEPIPDYPAIEILESSPFPSSPDDRNIAKLWEYSVRGRASNTIRLPGPYPAPLMNPGRGHGLCILANRWRVVATSEKMGGNYNEGWALVPPDVTGKLRPGDVPFYKSGDIFGGLVLGARHCLQFEDETILLGYPSRWVVCTFEQLLYGDMLGLPTWTLAGDSGQYTTYGTALVPGTKRVWFSSLTGATMIDFDIPPGAINPASVKRMAGSNIATPGFIEGEHIAIGPELRLYKQNVGRPGIPWWNAATLDALTATPTNPEPDGVLESEAFDNLTPGVELLFGGLDFDDLGRLWCCSQRSSNYTVPVIESGHAFRFSSAAALAGGPQVPEITIALHAESQPWDLRCVPRNRLHPR